MIGRMWRGITTPENADAYAEYLKVQMHPEDGDVEGNRGAFVFQRNIENGVEFVTIALFDSLDAVKVFAGESYEKAFLPPEEKALLSSFDSNATHYDVVIKPD